MPSICVLHLIDWVLFSGITIVLLKLVMYKVLAHGNTAS